MIERAKLLDGTYAREARAAGIVRVMSDEAREASRRTLLDQHRPNQDLWIFAYGSLIWNPQFHYREALPCRAYGYRRAFCMWSPYSQGTPEQPGLMLALERGGCCNGIALRIAAEQVEEETRVIWAREMFSGIYAPAWVSLQAETGPFRAITFLSNTESQLYGGNLTLEEQARVLATAAGSSGPNVDYLRRLAETLDRLGIADRVMRRLHSLVLGHRPIEA